MRIIVSDASVIFDLADADLLLRCFELPYEFQIPDVMFEEELVSVDAMRAELVSAGLLVASFSGQEVAALVELRHRFRSLSAPDAFALLLARRVGGILLTGDRRLRNAATAEGVERHGHLWLIERLSEHGIVANDVLAEALSDWKANIRVRLPGGEVDRTLKRLGR